MLTFDQNTPLTATLRRRARILRRAAIILPLIVACEPSRSPRPGAESRIVVYCSVDEAFARDVLRHYERDNDVKLDVIYDSEAGKTTGLVKRIITEAHSGRPRADLFWSSELFQTIRLARLGLLSPYESPRAADIPKRYRDPSGYWTALAARARVLAFDPTVVLAEEAPTRWEQLADEPFVSKTTIANPLFGTTRGHVAAMFALWGPQRARQFLTRLHNGGVLVSNGNSSAVRAVMAERAQYAATDTDDVWVAQRAGASLDLRYLDLGDGGTLLIPCSVALVRGGPNTNEAKKLVDYLVSSQVEQMLAESDSRNIPVRASLRQQLGLTWPPESKISFDAIADAMGAAEKAVREILIR